MPLNNPTKSGAAAAGTYVGDASVNKAIPHGLPGVPKLVVITEDSASTAIGDQVFTMAGGDDRLHLLQGGVNSTLEVTTPDSTNFYVGNATSYPNSANFNVRNYIWMAIP